MIFYAFDWDELLMICMGFAAVIGIVMEYRRDHRGDGQILDLTDRMARLETLAVDPARLARLEVQQEDLGRVHEHLAELRERIASMEVRLLAVVSSDDESSEEGDGE